MLLNRVTSKILVAVLTASSLTGLSAANAAETGAYQSDIENMVEIVPQIMAQTAPSEEIAITSTVNNSAYVIRDVGSGIENSPISIEVDNSAKPQFDQSGLAITQNWETGMDQFVQPLTRGFRILEVIKSQVSDHSFSFKVNMPEGAHLEIVDGAIRVLQGDEILGQVRSPWAVTNSGQPVETSFSLVGNVVTQRVAPAEPEDYPIVADPEWSYLYSYNLNISYSSAWSKIHSCFNCYFPVAGAPTAFPVTDQILPLKSYIGTMRYNMECRMGYAMTATTYDKWQFWATKNHIDGLGSNIVFTFQKNTTTTSKLIVDAWIVYDFPLGNALYAIAANANWQNFANNLNG